MMKKVWRELLILVLALMLLPGTLGAIGIGEQPTQVIEEKLDFSGKAQLTLINGVGTVEITGWDEQKIALHAVLRARTPEELAELGVAVEEQGDELIIRSRPVRFPLGFHGSVDYTLKVPNSARISVQNGVGDFSLSDFTGSLALELGVGSASIADAALAEVRLEIGAGELVELERVMGDELSLELGAVGHCRLEQIGGKDVRVNLGAGDLEVTITGDSWEIEAAVGVGSITLAGFSPSDVHRESHLFGESVEITVGSGENRLKLNVGAGSIKLELLGETGI